MIYNSNNPPDKGVRLEGKSIIIEDHANHSLEFYNLCPENLNLQTGEIDYRCLKTSTVSLGEGFELYKVNEKTHHYNDSSDRSGFSLTHLILKMKRKTCILIFKYTLQKFESVYEEYLSTVCFGDTFDFADASISADFDLFELIMCKKEEK